MSYGSVDALEDAYRATKGLLLPFEWRRWLALAVVVFFASGATGFDPGANVGVVDLPTPPSGARPGPNPGTGFLFDLPVVVALVAVAVVLAALFAFVGAVMEFVFVRAVATREVRLRAYARANVGEGLSLFGFRLLIGLVALAVVAFLAAILLATGLVGLVLVVLLSPIVAAGFVSLYLLHRFTVDFVVPVMLVEDVGVVAGWRRFGAELRAETAEYAVYALVRLALGVAASLVVGAGFALVALVVGVPFAAVWAVLALLGSAGVATTALLAIAATYAVVVGAVGIVAVQTPVSTYLRYYPLFVLGDVSPEYDLLEAVRREMDGDERGGGATAGGSDGEDGDSGGGDDYATALADGGDDEAGPPSGARRR